MFLIDLLGWLTFAALLVGAAWVAWHIYGELSDRGISDDREALEPLRESHHDHV